LWFISYLLGIRECEIERSRPRSRPFGPDAPSMPIGRFAARWPDRYPYPRIRLRCGDAEKCGRIIADIGHAKPAPLSRMKISALAVSFAPTKGDLSFCSLRSKFPGVSQQIVEHDFQELLSPRVVSSSLRLRITFRFGSRFLSSAAIARARSLKLTTSRRISLRRHAGQFQHVVDQLPPSPGFALRTSRR